MTLEKILCPVCKNQMKKGIPKMKISYVLEDGTTGDAKHNFMVCPVCSNVQIFPDVVKDNMTFQLFRE